MARVRSALRRRGGANLGTSRPFAEGTIDMAAHRVTVREQKIALTPREFDLLWCLAEHTGRVLTHRHLLEQVWGPAHVDDIDYLRVAVRSLRKKLEVEPAHPRLIINEPGVGYRLSGSVE